MANPHLVDRGLVPPDYHDPNAKNPYCMICGIDLGGINHETNEHSEARSALDRAIAEWAWKRS